MRLFITSLVLCASAVSVRGDIVATFEDQNLGSNTYRNDAGGGSNGVFTSFGNGFNNSYSSSFGGIWSGWAMSTSTDGTTPGYQNQYSAKPGSGAGGSATYAIGFPFGSGADPFHPATSVVDLVAGASALSIDVTNTTYAYFAMKNGDAFSKAFGPGSYFVLDIQGFDGAHGTGNQVGVVDFYLADFRNGAALIVDDWRTVDLTSLAGAHSLRFGLRSSDNDTNFGMNTPSYFAVDNLRLAAVPEPTGAVLLGLGLLQLALLRRGPWRRDA